MKKYFFLLLLIFSLASLSLQSSNIFKINYIKFLKNQAFRRNLDLNLYEVILVKSSVVSEKTLDEQKFSYVFAEWQKYEKIQKLQEEILSRSIGLKNLSDERSEDSSWNLIIEGNQRDIDETNKIIDLLVIASEQLMVKIEKDDYTRKIKMSIFKLKYTIVDKQGKSFNFLENVMVFFDGKNQVIPIYTRLH